MAVRVADSLKQQNDLKTFPVAYSEDIWLDENKGEGDANFKDLQTLYNENKLGGSGLPEPESADKVLLSASSNTRADGLEWKQVSKNDVGLQLPEFESLEEWDSLPADEKSKYYNAGKGYVVIKEDVKGAKGVIDDTKPASTVTTLSAKKISDNLGGKADANKVVPKITITDTTTADAKSIIEKNWSTFPGETSTAVIGTSNYGYNALINKQGKYGTVTLTTPVSGEPFYYGVLGGTSWTWQELATMDKVVPQVKIENRTTDDARTIIKNSWSTLPKNNSIVRIETSIFTWSAQIYKHDDSWGTIILTCYADNKDSYIGKISNQVWHWYKMGLTEV